MAVPREKVLISAAGKDGDHAIQYFGHRDNVAQFGRNGANGRSATSPSAGTDGRDISVQLSYSSTDHAILVEGTKGWKGPDDGQTRWLVPESHVLLLDCKGGDGGKGGNGEDGQQGGQGARGRDATKHRDAEDGHEGAPGGDGGQGSNGGNGGKAGKVLITVNEDDLDLLIPVYWDIRGGKGGESGTHGDPGDGGLGGDPGDGITWTEHRQNETITRTRGPGRRGRVGPPGARPPTYLQGGVGGAQGSSQVTVKRNNGTEATYPTRYELKVISFDIVDENDDGINEPGEHLLVKNIRVQNTGGMPSPKNHEVQVLIHGTHWLEPIASEPVFLPKEIPVDETVLVPGVLRAFIMQERVPRAPGQKFFATDEVQLIATMGRINRIIPEFTGSKKIDIRYPLELDAPKYLDCVAPGDHITFPWTLRNISKKPYGIKGLLQRSAATCLTDPGRLFHFIEAEGTNTNQMVDPLGQLDPGSEVPISQTFKVSDMAFPFSSGILSLELLLSEPGCDENRFSDVGIHEHDGTKLRSVMTYSMEMQISGVYSYNPNSLFLLVVNSQTPNSAIHQIIDFIRNGLNLQLDIFNLSVGGSFTDPATNKNVISKYTGKSIIVFGNKFPYFSMGTSSAFELLDPWLACQQAACGTHFHFAGATDNFESMRAWATMATFPVNQHDGSNTSESIHSETLKELATTLHSRTPPAAPTALPIHSIASKKSLFGSPDSSLASATRKTAKGLDEKFPLRKFAVVGDPSTRTASMPGRVIIREGFPKTASISVSLLEYSADDGELPDYQKYMIVATLPFHTRARMFWNMAGALDAGGVDSLTLLKGKMLEPYKTPATGPRIITEKVCKAICLSIEYDLGREIGRFSSNAPSFDSIPREHSLRQLPLLTKFFDMEPPSETVRSSERTQFIVQTLGIIQGSLLPLGFLEGFRRMITPCVDRKGGLKTQVDTKIDEFLSRRFAPEVVTYLKSESARDGKATKKAIKRIQGAKDTTSVTLSRVSTLVDIPNTRFDDLTEINPSSVAWTQTVANGKVAEYSQHSNMIRRQETGSKNMLLEMVEPIRA